MPLNLAALVEELDAMTVGQLRERYREVLGEESRTGNAAYLRRRIAWQVQARAEGGLSERAKRLAAELADLAFLRTSAPRVRSAPASGPSSRPSPNRRASRSNVRIPPPGSVLRREFRGRTIEVRVLKTGFDWDSRRFDTLTAIANEATGSHWNGPAFFGLRRKGGRG
jgi:hypothetical protein